jgi:uncharacterized membrane protein YfcA
LAVIGLFLLVGISLGLLGGGGSILTVPLLVYVAGVNAKAAVAMSLLVVGATSVFALLPYARRGHIDYRTAAVFGPLSMVGAYGGGVLAKYFSDTALLVMFGAMMLAASIAMLKGRATAPVRPLPGGQRHVLLALEGVVVGAFTGLVGAGGGFLVVPALVLLAKLEMRRAIGTSLLIIVLKSSAGLMGHLQHMSLDWSLTLTLAAAAAVGALIGAALAGRVPARALRRGFGGFVLAMGALVLGLQLPEDTLARVLDNAGWTVAGFAALAVGIASWGAVRALRRSALGARQAVEAASLSVAPPPAEAAVRR